MGQALLQVRGVSKDFPGNRALDRVDLEVRSGEIVALAGANGSGKSTLVKILAGYHQPDEGQITAFGDEIWPATALSAWRQRSHFVHQELGLVHSLTVADNLALGAGYETGRFRRIAWRRQRAAARRALDRFGGTVDVRSLVGELPHGERSIVAMARALTGWGIEQGLLVVDEPTAALERDDVEVLFAAVRKIADAGAGVIFISHRLEEILELANRVVVLRDGRVAASVATSDLTADALVELIVGRRVDDLYADPPPPRNDVVLSVRGLSGDRIHDLSFDLHEGEILGVSGLLGSGREELPELLQGGTPRVGGEVSVLGSSVRPGSPRDALRKGLVLAPADRLRRALIARHGVRENVTLSELGRCWRRGRLDRGRERREVSEWIQRLSLRPNDPELPIAQLSGGNQQKALLAKWLRTEPRVVVLDDPTQGVDIGARAAIYRELAHSAREGTGLLICSSDAKELAAMCDRVLVLAGGRLAAELHGRSLTVNQIVSETVRVHASPLSE